MIALALLAILGNLPLIVAVAGHIRAHRIHNELDDIDRIEAGFHTWADHTPVVPLRAVAWPTRQTPTDVAAAYEPVPWTDPDWALRELAVIVAAARQYEGLVAA